MRQISTARAVSAAFWCGSRNASSIAFGVATWAAFGALVQTRFAAGSIAQAQNWPSPLANVPA